MEQTIDNVSVMHIPTEEEVAAIKNAAISYAQASGEAIPLVFKASFCGGKTEFIVKWLTSETWQSIINNKDYQKQLVDNPDAADFFMRMKVFKECVLWPPTFKPELSDKNQKYPAGVLGALLDKIMFASGFTQDAAPDKVLVAPVEPVEPDSDELRRIMLAHPLASVFGTAFEKPFFIRDYNPELGDYELVLTRYYIYTLADRATYTDMQAVGNDEAKAISIVLNNCVLWPQNIDWDKEPAQYGEWLVRSILTQSGIGLDPTTGIEEV